LAKTKFYELHEVPIEDLSSEGKGIVKHEGKVIFVDGGITGDVVTIQVKKNHKNFESGKILKLISPSNNRLKPYCQHYEQCGGCKTQHIDYETQLIWKQEVVTNALERIGGFKNLDIRPIVGCVNTEHYRNKLDYAVSNKRWLSKEEAQSDETFNRNGIGFHLAGMFDKVLDVHQCFHMPDLNNDIRNFIREKAFELEVSFYDIIEKKGCLRNILVRNNVKTEWMICFQVYDMEDNFMRLLESLKNNFPQIISLQYTINRKSNDTIYDQEIQVFHGQDFIYEYLKEKKFRITPKSFFQTNTEQCIRLYDLIGEMAGIQEGQVVYDLYCGVGSIGIYLAEKAKKVVGIELVEEAIVDARMNAKINGLENCEYFAADIRDIFKSDFIAKAGKPDAIITDPPRAGMHPDVVNELSQSGCPKIVYVSCNPQTMSNDLKTLTENYHIRQVKPVDMFPHTIHIECIVLLEKK
jgi:23S rRNA (uracil1939-C5)-methyltransferase